MCPSSHFKSDISSVMLVKHIPWQVVQFLLWMMSHQGDLLIMYPAWLIKQLPRQLVCLPLLDVMSYNGGYLSRYPGKLSDLSSRYTDNVSIFPSQEWCLIKESLWTIAWTSCLASLICVAESGVSSVRLIKQLPRQVAPACVINPHTELINS